MTSIEHEYEFFTEVLGHSTDERLAFIEARHAGNPRLQHRLRRLLEAHHRAERMDDGTSILADDGGDVECHPKCIDAYNILDVIGEGGMGVVYAAEQSVPFRRRVALKVVKLGMDTRAVVSRFEAERQALALMDHPGIAKVFDAGVTTDVY